jgi:pilus assembly protein CpaC
LARRSETGKNAAPLTTKGFQTSKEPIMIQRRYSIRFVAIVATFLLCGFPLFAQDQSTNAAFGTKEVIPVNVLVGQSKLITFDHSIERFSVSNPEIAEAVLVAGNQVVVNGKAFGQINFIAWEKNTGRFLVFDVYVRTNLSLIDSQIHALFPKDDIRLSQANGSVVMSGSVSDPRIASQADAVIQAAGFKTVNLLESPVKDSSQVQLMVRVAEVNRTKMRELGTSYGYLGSPGAGGYLNSGQGPSALSEATSTVLKSSITSSLNLFLMGGNTLAMIRAMQQNGALRALAEPNLIAMNGQEASFLAGGEYPVPIVQGGGSGGAPTVTIVFKEYGVRLNFKPTIIDEDHIRLELEPEVSTLDFANGVSFEGFRIPALRTRRAKTGIELRDGQSFALAGLLDNSETKSFSKVPGLGDIPILGSLFRSTQFQKNESELMFIVTAQMVKPVNRDDLPRIPAVENLKNGSLLGVEPKSGAMTGPSGFIINSESTGTVSDTAQPATPKTTPNGASSKVGAADVSVVPGTAGPTQAVKVNPNP